MNGAAARRIPDPDACHLENHRYNGTALRGMLSQLEREGVPLHARQLLHQIVIANGDLAAPLPSSWARARTDHAKRSHFRALAYLKSRPELLEYVKGPYGVCDDCKRRGKPHPIRMHPTVRIGSMVRFVATEGVPSRDEIHRRARKHVFQAIGILTSSGVGGGAPPTRSTFRSQLPSSSSASLALTAVSSKATSGPGPPGCGTCGPCARGDGAHCIAR